MSSTNKTANFKLSQFIGTDKPTFLGDYNNDMEIIDGALFTASQTAEEAVNDVETVKSAQAELKAVHEDTKKQVAQLKETADGMTGDVTAAQEAANSAEQKATAAQTAATDVVNAANAASANATKAKQTADGNKTTLEELDRRVTALEGAPKEQIIKLGTGASFNVSTYDGYQNFTKDNFLVVCDRVSVTNNFTENDAYNGNVPINNAIDVKYTASNGSVTITGITGSGHAKQSGNNGVITTLNVTVTVYLVIK
jgi:membrane protein involved in colicin uptake